MKRFALAVTVCENKLLFGSKAQQMTSPDKHHTRHHKKAEPTHGQLYSHGRWIEA